MQPKPAALELLFMVKTAHVQTGTSSENYINAVADAGAECYRICDTVGIGLSDPEAPLPHGIPAKVLAIKKETRMSAIEIHAHDDFGNAVENTMAGIKAASGVWDKVYASSTAILALVNVQATQKQKKSYSTCTCIMAS